MQRIPEVQAGADTCDAGGGVNAEADGAAEIATPFEEDFAIGRSAQRFGLQMERRQAVVITDLKAVQAAGLTRVSPDYSRIRRLLDDGATVAGAELGGVEYVLRRSK